jgi:hypothetical protein
MSGSALNSVVRLAITVAGYAFGGPVGGLVAGLVASMVFKDDVPGTSNTSSEPSAQTVRSSKAAARFILGRASTGGVFAWAQEQAGGQTGGEWLHLVYVLHEGSIAGVDEIYLNEELISTYGADATYEVIINPTTANAFLLANSPSWLQSQIGRGLSFIRISLRYNGEKFPSGIPTLRCVVRGTTDVYDPRSGTSSYSENTALHILWFLRNRCGVPDDEIALATFASAANVCEEPVTNPDGTSSHRYSTGAVIAADEARTDVLPKLVKSCAGSLTRVGGLWSLQAGAYYGPYDFTITEDMVIGTVSGTTEVSNDNAINTARGTFVDPSQAWADTDYPEVAVAEWITEDGGESAESLTFPYITNAYQAQRLANIELRRRRAGGSVKIPMDYNGYNCRPGRVIKVDLPSLNISGEMEVTDWQMSYDSACIVTVRSYEAAIFDDAVGQPYNPLGFISLPSGGLGTVTNLAWTPADSAEVIQGVLSWTPPAQTVLSYTISIKSGASVVQAIKAGGDAISCNVNGLDSGDYTMSVTAFGAGTRSGEATITVDINGPAAPEVCAVFPGNLELTLVPSTPSKGINGGTYEFYYSLEPVPNGLQATYVGSGLTLTHTGLAFATSYHYYIRAVNAYGTSGFLHVIAQTSDDISQMLLALAGGVGKTELSQELNERIDLIDGDGPGSVNERLTDLKDNIGDLVDALVYVPTDAYVRDNTVRVGDNLWTAIADVPAAADGSNGPPNGNYWVNSGQSIRTANGLAAQVTRNTADISTVEGQTTANAEQISAIETTVNDPDTGLTATASGLNSLEGTVSTLDGKITTQATRLEGVFAQVNPAQAGDGSALAGNDTLLVGVWSEQSARIEDGVATGQRIDTVTASVNATRAAVLTETTARATAAASLASQITTVQAVAAGASSAVQTLSSAQAGTDNKLSAMWAVKLQVNARGQYVVAGIGAGIENVGGTLQSNIIFQANTISFANPNGDGSLSYPFIISGGVNYFNSAFFQDASISFLKVGDNVQSSNYVSGSTGWRLAKDGGFEINGVVAGGGRIALTNRALKVFDQNGVLRVQLGDLTA